MWCPKYRKRVLTGQVATRVRDLLRQIAAENELEIISGKVAADHVLQRPTSSDAIVAGDRMGREVLATHRRPRRAGCCKADKPNAAAEPCR